MVAERRGLRPGRPQEQGPHLSFLETRRQGIAEVRPGWACVGMAPYAFIDTAAVSVVNTVHLQAIGYLPRNTSVDMASLRMTVAGAAGSKARAALYILDILSRTWKIVRGSEVTFDTASIGVKEVSFDRIELDRDTYYALGFAATDVTAEFASIVGNGPFAGYEIAGHDERLIPIIPKANTARVYGPKFGVIYQADAIGGEV